MADEGLNIKAISFSIVARAKGMSETINQAREMAKELQFAENAVKKLDTQTLNKLKKQFVEVGEDLEWAKEQIKIVEEMLQAARSGSQQEAELRLRMNDLRIQTREWQKEYDELDAKIQGHIEVVKAEKDAEAMAKREKADAIQVTNATGAAITGITDALGGSTAAVAPFVRQLQLMRQAMTGASSSSAAMATGVLGVIVIIMQACKLIADARQQAQEEQMRLSKQAVLDLAETTAAINNARSAMKVLENEYSTTEDIAVARNKIAEALENTVIGYDNVGNAILVDNEALEEQIKLLEKKALIESKVAAGGLEGYIKQYNDATGNLGADLEYFVTTTPILKDSGVALSFSNWLKNILPEEDNTDRYQYLDDITNSVVADIENRLGRELPEKIRNTIESNIYMNASASSETKLREDISDLLYEEYVAGFESFTRRINSELQTEVQTASDGLKSAYNIVFNKAYEHLEDNKLQGNQFYDNINAALTGLLHDTGSIEELAETYSEIQKKILEGTANASEIEKYNEFSSIIGDSIDVAATRLERAGIDDAAAVATSAIEAILGASTETVYQLQKQAAATASLSLTTKDAAEQTSNVYEAYKNLKDSIADINEMEKVVAVIKEGNNASEDYKKALSYLANAYSVAEEDAANYVEQLETEKSLAIATAELERQETLAKIESAKASFSQALARKKAAGATEEECQALKVYIEAMEDAYNLYTDMSISELIKAQWRESGETQSSVIQNMISDMERLKSLDQLTYEEELNYLNKIAKQGSITAEEKEDIEKRIYDLKKNHRQAEYDSLVYYDKLSLTQQQSYLKELIAQYKEGVDARINLEKKLYSLQKEQISNLGEAVVDALKNKYQVWLDEENSVLDKSISNWQNWADEQTAAIQAQIDALNDLTTQEDREAQEAEKRRKIAALEQELLYANDEYSARKLKEQIDIAKKELQELLSSWERQDLIADLQKQMQAVQDKANEKINELETTKSEKEEQFDKLTESSALQAEAEKLLLEGSQKEILSLLETYAEDYEKIGISFADRFVSGFMEVVDDVTAWFESFDAKIVEYQTALANAANESADAFWNRQHVENASLSTASTTNTITINFNQPVESPTEVRRELERMLISMNNL